MLRVKIRTLYIVWTLVFAMQSTLLANEFADELAAPELLHRELARMHTAFEHAIPFAPDRQLLRFFSRDELDEYGIMFPRDVIDGRLVPTIDDVQDVDADNVFIDEGLPTSVFVSGNSGITAYQQPAVSGEHLRERQARFAALAAHQAQPSQASLGAIPALAHLLTDMFGAFDGSQRPAHMLSPSLPITPRTPVMQGLCRSEMPASGQKRERGESAETPTPKRGRTQEAQEFLTLEDLSPIHGVLRPFGQALNDEGGANTPFGSAKTLSFKE